MFASKDWHPKYNWPYYTDNCVFTAVSSLQIKQQKSFALLNQANIVSTLLFWNWDGAISCTNKNSKLQTNIHFSRSFENISNSRQSKNIAKRSNMLVVCWSITSFLSWKRLSRCSWAKIQWNRLSRSFNGKRERDATGWMNRQGWNGWGTS